MEASEQMGGVTGPDLTPDVATTQRATDRSDVVTLIGYLGEGCSDQYRRLYESVALNRWIEILVVDIVDRAAAPGGEDAGAPQSVVWVRRDAELAVCEAVRASSFAEPPGPVHQLKWPRP